MSMNPAGFSGKTLSGIPLYNHRTGRSNDLSSCITATVYIINLNHQALEGIPVPILLLKIAMFSFFSC